MNTHHPSLLFFMILMALPSLVLLTGNKANGATVQDEPLPNTTHDQSPSQDNPRSSPAQDKPLPNTPRDYPLALGHQSLFVPESLREIFAGRVRIEVIPHVKKMAVQLMIRQGERGLKHIQDLGFEDLQSDTDINSLDIDVANPIKIYEVSLKNLQAFVPGTNPESLLQDTGQLLFPMTVKKQVRSSMTFRCVRDRKTAVELMEDQECWRPTSVGRPNLIRLVAEKQLTLDVKDEDFLVSIPALNRTFLGYEEKKNAIIWLIPLVKDHHFTKEEPHRAQDVFTWLSDEANHMDDSPR